MKAVRESREHEVVERGKYAPLYRYLTRQAGPEWRTSFGRIEEILRCKLPKSARCHRTWWANAKSGGGHSHALAWRLAGWKTRAVDLEAETLVFELDPERERAPQIPINLDELLPVRDLGPWPEGFTVSREQIYEDRV